MPLDSSLAFSQRTFFRLLLVHLPALYPGGRAVMWLLLARHSGEALDFREYQSELQSLEGGGPVGNSDRRRLPSSVKHNSGTLGRRHRLTNMTVGTQAGVGAVDVKLEKTSSRWEGILRGSGCGGRCRRQCVWRMARTLVTIKAKHLKCMIYTVGQITIYKGCIHQNSSYPGVCVSSSFHYLISNAAF